MKRSIGVAAFVLILGAASRLRAQEITEEEPPPQEVVVSAPRPTRRAGEIRVPATEARKVAGTEDDPVKAVQNLPGVARPSFGASPLIVWGAAPGDTRIYVDGVDVPRIFHGSALRSTINGDLVDSVTLTPAAFGAEYGRGIGGVVLVETRDLPRKGVHGYVGADTLDGSAAASAAVTDRLRVAVAGRYGWLDGVMKAVDAPDVGDFYAIPRYRDAQMKWQLDLGERESLELVALGSGDDLTRNIPDVDPARVRSATTSDSFQRLYLRYRRQGEDGTAVEVVPWFGHDRARLDARFGADPAILDERAWRWGLRAAYRSPLGQNHRLTLGIDVGAAHAEVARSGSLTIPPREGDVAVFGQPPGDDVNTDDWGDAVVNVAPHAFCDLVFNPLVLTAGLRLDGYLLDASRQTPRVGQTPAIGYTQLAVEVEPRVSARLRLSPRVTMLAAAGLYAQPPAAADLSAVFGSPTLGPEAATHLTLGESTLLTSTLSAEVTGFYKWMRHLAVRDPSPTPKLAHALIEDGVGRSFGVQLVLRQAPWHGFFGWLAYTISRSERRATSDESWRLFDDDQPHLFTLVASKMAGPWTFGLRFRYASGLPRTPVTGSFYDTKDDRYQPIFGTPNSIRLPDFWQLDLRVDRAFALGETGARLLLYLEGLNVTNHTNSEEYVYNVDYRRRGVVTGLPIIGVLGARVEL